MFFFKFEKSLILVMKEDLLSREFPINNDWDNDVLKFILCDSCVHFGTLKNIRTSGQC